MLGRIQFPNGHQQGNVPRAPQAEENLFARNVVMRDGLRGRPHTLHRHNWEMYMPEFMYDFCPVRDILQLIYEYVIIMEEWDEHVMKVNCDVMKHKVVAKIPLMRDLFRLNGGVKRMYYGADGQLYGVSIEPTNWFARNREGGGMFPLQQVVAWFIDDGVHGDEWSILDIYRTPLQTAESNPPLRRGYWPEAMFYITQTPKIDYKNYDLDAPYDDGQPGDIIVFHRTE